MSTLDAQLARLKALSTGFRDRYLPYDDLTRQLHAWADAFPSFVRVDSLGVTPEERHVWLLIIGPSPSRVRPAAWVDGNMHASELAGSSVALAIAEDALRAHLGPGAPLRDLPEHVGELLRSGVLLYVVPRICPDGAERVLTTGAYVRSNPRDDRLGRTAPFWRGADVDGDGRVRLMRRLDPAGDFTAFADQPDLLLPRRVEDPGPFYALYPEGFVENWDGFTVPGAGDFLSDTATDLNRNFPYDWAPEPRQIGAGAFPTSEPEARAVVEFATRHPNIFAWLNLHTFGGCYIRPSGDKTDKQMDQSDLALYHQIEEWTDRITTYPMVSGFEEFTYEPDKPLRGDLSTYAYEQRGAIGMVCELWDFWRQVGVSVLRPFVWNLQRRSREDCLAMAKWDREHNEGRVVGSWTPFDHPQLGAVEIGGFDPRFGIWNPPPDRLAYVCEQQARVFLRIAALAPRLRWGEVEVQRLGEGLTAVRAVVENTGYLPTNVLASAKALPWNDPVRARAVLGEGLELATGEEVQLVGHLGGWGGFRKMATPAFARTEGDAVRRRVGWVVRGEGRLVLRAGCARVGQVETSVEVAGPQSPAAGR
jgi:hypothetical protein